MIGKSLIIFLLLISILLLSACSSRMATSAPTKAVEESTQSAEKIATPQTEAVPPVGSSGSTTVVTTPETQRSDVSDNIPKPPEVIKETTDPVVATDKVKETQQDDVAKISETSKETTTPTTTVVSEAPKVQGGVSTVGNIACSEKPVAHPSITGKYKGECKNGLANGRGIAIGKDQYEGQFKKGMMNGEGTYTWANGDSYDGRFSDDKKQGEGMFYEAKTDKLFVIEFLNDKEVDRTPEQNTTPQQSLPTPSTEVGLTKFRDELRPGMMTMQGLIIEVKKPERIAKVQTEGSTVSTEGSVSFGIIEKWMPFSEIHPLRENY